MMTKRKLVSAVLALAFALPSVTALADDPVTPSTTKPEVTVVGKRIKGDDNYFEISLEVNGEYEDYSAVGVVLEYDPEIIVPADSWDDEAGKADMSAAKSWATRRALPTLGKDTWSTHTALTYIEQTEEPDPNDSTVTITKQGKGYLYLGAEYPGKQPNTDTEDGDSGSSSDDSDGTDAAAAEEDPENPHANPVVVARFMYASDTAKNTLVTNWTDAWDKDWTKNEILTIAPDEVAAKSPAQYPFAYYGADFSERAYMKTFPTPTATPDTSVTATRAPYTPPATGSAIAETDKLTKDDIEIVTCEGKSAKSGGLELSDVFAIIFLDWDNSIIGALTAAVNAKDMAEVVNTYVNDKLVHEDLRMENQNYENLVSTGDYLQRKFSYRGEYPYDKPSTTNPTVPDPTNAKAVSDGEKYPLTNKLDYVFAGKDIDPKLPFANGWVQVATKDMDYSDKQGYWKDVLPKNMNETFTWWTQLGDETFDRAPELNEDGTLVNSSDKIPTYPLYDFDNITKDDLEYGDGNLYVKAAYEKGSMLNGNSDGSYATIGPPDKNIATSNTVSTTFSIKFYMRRMNKYGYGVQKIKTPAIRMALTQVGASAETNLGVFLENSENMEVELMPTDAVQTVGYILMDTYEKTIVTGTERGLENELGIFEIAGASGLAFTISAEPFLKEGYNYTVNPSQMPSKWPTLAQLQSLKLHPSASGNYNGKTYTKASAPMKALFQEAGSNYANLTWYQLQYAVVQTTAPYYVDNTTAKKFCDDNGYKMQ